MQQMRIVSHRLLCIVLAIAALLTFLSFTSVHAHPARHTSTGSSLYLQNVRDSQFPDYYQLSGNIPSSSTPIAPRAYWITPVLSTTYAAGTWTLTVTVTVSTVPSINVYTLAVLTQNGTWVQTIGEGAISHRYNMVGAQNDIVTFLSSTSIMLKNERLEVSYIVPNWCTAAPIRTGPQTYLHLPTQR